MRANVMVLGLLLAGAFSAMSQDLRVTATEQAIPGAGRVSWGGKNGLLAYDKAGGGGFYDVYTSNPDGSNEVCLTCGAAQFFYSKGNPEWHPSNQFLAVQIQWAVSFLGQSLDTPGAGVDNDLYIMDAAGLNYWPVTHSAKGVLHPRFSHNGNQLLWVQRTIGNNWQLMLGDFAVANGAPQVTNIQSLPPCDSGVFCETGGFSADDTTVFFTHSAAAGGSTVFDIFSYNLNSRVASNLTNSVTNWNEFPTSFPSANRILWMSGIYTSQGLETDYWMMDADGSNKVQLTYYNDPTAPSWYLGSVATAKFSWSPDGTQLAAYLIPNGTGNGQTGNIEIVTLEPAAASVSAASFGRPPISADSIVSTFYPNLGLGTEAASSAALPNALAGTTATLTDAQGVQRPSPLFFVSPNQVNWLVPGGTAPGPATLAIVNSAGVAARGTINVQPAAPGLFSASATGAGAAAGYLLTYAAGSGTAYDSQSTSVCPPVTGCVAAPLSLGAATDGAYLVLFGTGLRHATKVSAQVQGHDLPVTYSGPQTGFAGLDQVNILLPHNLTGQGLVTVSVTADGVLSNIVQILVN